MGKNDNHFFGGKAMKRKFTAIMIGVAIAALIAWSHSESAGLPASGDFTVVGNNDGDASFEVGEGGLVVVKMPILGDQKNLPKDWTAACSYAVNKDGQWILLAEDAYELPTTIDGNLVVGGGKIETSGVEWVWPRCWGHDKGGKNWLWINQVGKHTRPDKNGNPGYEAIINIKTGEVSTVPASYMTRN